MSVEDYGGLFQVLQLLLTICITHKQEGIRFGLPTWPSSHERITGDAVYDSSSPNLHDTQK